MALAWLDGVRALTQLTLKRLGYTVLCAASAEQAVAVVAGSACPVDLLLTDVRFEHDGGIRCAGVVVA